MINTNEFFKTTFYLTLSQAPPLHLRNFISHCSMELVLSIEISLFLTILKFSINKNE